MKYIILSFVFLTGIHAEVVHAQSFEWARSGGGTGNDWGTGVTVDDSGNSYVVGGFISSTIDFGTETLTNSGIVGSPDIFVVKYNPSGSLLWARQAGSTRLDYVAGIGSDKYGNTVIAGFFNGPTINFGSDTLKNLHLSEMFLTKFDYNGTALWARSIGNPVWVEVYGVTMDTSGNSFVVGWFRSPTVIFGADTLTNSAGLCGSDLCPSTFIVKYDEDGTVLWAKSAEGGGSSRSVAVDQIGNSYMVGTFGQYIDFGTGQLLSAGYGDIFIVKYDSGGTTHWAKRSGGPGLEFVMDVAVDNSGNSYMVGYFQDSTMNFGADTLYNAGNRDIFIVKYDSIGSVLWANRVGGIYDDHATGVTVDNSGNSYVVGYFSSPTIVFGTDTLARGGGADLYIVKYDPDGEYLWVKSVSGIGNLSKVDVDDSSNIFMAGTFRGWIGYTIVFDTDTLICAGDDDVFIVKIGGDITEVNPRLTNIPDAYSLLPNYPNPFNPSTEITYSLSNAGHVTLRIYDVLGRELTTLVDERKEVGNHTIGWNAEGYPSGLYLYRLTAGNFRETKKMVLIR